MFIAVYTFSVIPGKEQEFEESWTERTIEIKETYKSLGSRLHRASDGKYVGYAQWKSKQEWETLQPSSTPSGSRMRACCTEITTVFQLEVVKDLLEHIS